MLVMIHIHYLSNTKHDGFGVGGQYFLPMNFNIDKSDQSFTTQYNVYKYKNHFMK